MLGQQEIRRECHIRNVINVRSVANNGGQLERNVRSEESL